MPRGERERAGEETQPGRKGKGAVVGAAEGRSRAREVGVTCSACGSRGRVAAGDPGGSGERGAGRLRGTWGCRAPRQGPGRRKNRV